MPEGDKQVGIHYPVLVLAARRRLSPETLKAIDAYAAKGGKRYA